MTAGFGSGNIWKGELLTLMREYRSNLPPEMAGLDYRVDESFVLWSSIGFSDLAFRWLLYPAEADTGYTASSGFTTDKPLFADALMKNEFGMAPMPRQGKPVVMRPIGENVSGAKGAVIVYGENGITALIPHTDPVATFGTRHLLDVGIAGRGAVWGDDYRHVFVDNLGCVWSLDINLNLIPHGYEEFFKGKDKVVVSGRSTRREQEYYLCDGFRGYNLVSNGNEVALGEQTQLLTSVALINGKHIGVARNLADEGMFIETETIINDTTGEKFITDVEVLADSAEHLEIAAKVRYSPDEDFVFTEWVPVNERGVAYLGVAATEYRILIRRKSHSTGSKTAQFWYQSVDRRSTRGPSLGALSQRG